ncbi:hypothetical protein FDECE_12486 [Fusarium decemcellulare]|nr:hypothetical protein FDECE_12486 [Fusarium decemcellulare]
MTIVVTGLAISTRTQRVLLVLEEIGLPYELRVVDLRNGEHKTPNFRMKYNPFGKVPVFEDGDTKLFESRAICRYIATKYKSSLMPVNIETLGFFEQIDSVGYGFLDTAIDYVADEMIFRRYAITSLAMSTALDYNTTVG